MKRGVVVVLSVAAVAAVAAAGIAWERGRVVAPLKAVAPEISTVDVVTAPVEVREIPRVYELVGRTEARASVAVKARVDGMIAELAYRQGRPVKKGQLLVRLDDALLQTQLRQAEAVAARDEALVQKSKADLQRSETLLARGFVSSSAVDQARSALEVDQASLRADRAAQDSTRLQLQFTRVVAPLDGVAGIAQLTVGGAVKANDTTLVVIDQVDPIYVTFTLPESRLAEVRAAMVPGPVSVDATITGVPSTMHGQLAFLDNAVDTSTGALTAKAVFSNPGALLTPGQFASLRLLVGHLSAAAAVPVGAVESGADSAYVFVVDAGDRARLRQVKVVAESDGWAALTGVAAGERVAITELEKLRDGAAVHVVPAHPAAASATRAVAP